MNKMIKITKEMRDKVEDFRLRHELTKSALSLLFSSHAVFIHNFAKQDTVQSKTWERMEKAMAKRDSSATTSPKNRVRAFVLNLLNNSTVKQAADTIGVSETTIYRVKDGTVSDDMVEQMAETISALESKEKAFRANGTLKIETNGVAKKLTSSSKKDFSCVRPQVRLELAKLELLKKLGDKKYNKDEERYIIEALSKL